MDVTLPEAPTARDRLALGVLVVAVIGVVLAALPYKLFDLDRFFIPKELVLHVGAGVCGVLLLLSERRRLPLTAVDVLLAAFLVVSAISALFATNGWVAWRAVALSCSGVILFACASRLTMVGFGRWIIGAAAVATVVGAGTALVQSYAGAATDLFSLNRAPGGTFGNRNFMAHLCAIGAPALVIGTVQARRGWVAVAGAIGTTIIAAALVLSRSRAAWLALAAGAAVMIGSAWLFRPRLGGAGVGRRLAFVVVAAVTGALVAAFLPNRLEWKSASPYLDTVRGVVNYKDGSGRGRLVQYTNSLRLFSAHPLLGVGPGNWPVDYPRLAVRDDPSLAEDSGMTDNPWPSSDWVAFLTERGAIGTVCLALALLGLLGRAVDELRGDRDRSAGGLILIGMLATVIVAGAFDAVLLLAVPTTVVWAAVGAVAPRGRTRLSVPGRFAIVLVAIVCGLAVVRSGLQWAAMASANGATRLAAFEHAASLDPGSYKIRIRTAQAAVARGDCRTADVEARAAAKLFPSAGEPKSVLRRCR